jgi:hypothetical protein
MSPSIWNWHPAEVTYISPCSLSLSFLHKCHSSIILSVLLNILRLLSLNTVAIDSLIQNFHQHQLWHVPSGTPRQKMTISIANHTCPTPPSLTESKFPVKTFPLIYRELNWFLQLHSKQSSEMLLSITLLSFSAAVLLLYHAWSSLPSWHSMLHIWVNHESSISISALTDHSYSSLTSPRILKICLVIPYYSLTSFLSICFPKIFVFINAWFSYIEAVSFATLFLLLCEYISPSESERELFFAALEIKQKNGPALKGNETLAWYRVCGANFIYPKSFRN